MVLRLISIGQPVINNSQEAKRLKTPQQYFYVNEISVVSCFTQNKSANRNTNLN